MYVIYRQLNRHDDLPVEISDFAEDGGHGAKVASGVEFYVHNFEAIRRNSRENLPLKPHNLWTFRDNLTAIGGVSLTLLALITFAGYILTGVAMAFAVVYWIVLAVSAIFN